MPDEKDRYGDKLRDLEHAREDKFIAERERDLAEKMRAQAASKQAADTRAGAHMRCPKCGQGLAAANHFEVTVQECANCGGMWLDKGELDALAKRESTGWLARYLGRPR
jgi:ribosomal protein S27AE